MARLTVEIGVPSDREDGCELARSVHEEGIFASIPFSEAKFYKYFDNTIDDPENFLSLAAKLDGKLVGFAYCYVGGYFIGSEATVVTVNTICVDKSVRSGILGGKVAVKLVKAIETWAKSRGAHLILYHVTSGRGVSGIDRFFRKMGMTTLGGNYGVRI
jgi:GNAT superfamily N-acetyltransferase